MHSEHAASSLNPDLFSLDVFSELPEETIQRRWQAVNVLLRMSMLAGLEMRMEATLNLICDLAAEITPYARGAMYSISGPPRLSVHYSSAREFIRKATRC
jgi:hypothetical protein